MELKTIETFEGWVTVRLSHRVTYYGQDLLGHRVKCTQLVLGMASCHCSRDACGSEAGIL